MGKYWTSSCKVKKENPTLAEGQYLIFYVCARVISNPTTTVYLPMQATLLNLYSKYIVSLIKIPVTHYNHLDMSEN